MPPVKAPHHPRAKKWQRTVVSVSKKENTKIHKTYRDASGLSNIEKYNIRRREEAQNPGNKKVTKTVREWAEIVKSREDALSLWRRADDNLNVQIERALGYQKQIGELNRELWWKRTGAFLLGAGFGCLLSYLIIIFY
jgi:hypothetical protein